MAFQSLISVRKEPDHKSEMGTQLLFGEHYRVKEVSDDGKWVHIENGFDGYTGWISSKQNKSVSQEYYDILKSMEWPKSKDLIGLVHAPHKVIPIVYGSVMPVFNQGVLVMEGIACKYQGEVFYPVKLEEFSAIFAIARFFMAAPYLWGGKSPFGVDCSGLVQQVYRMCGYKLPRDAEDQVSVGESVSVSGSQPGDLAFFKDEKGAVSHVGIICENLSILHASGEVRLDKLDEKGIFNFDLKAYTHLLHSVKRVI
jgi:hypothetical protein